VKVITTRTAIRRSARFLLLLHAAFFLFALALVAWGRFFYLPGKVWNVAVTFVLIDFLAQCLIGFTMLTFGVLRTSLGLARSAAEWTSEDLYWNLILIVMALTCLAIWIPWVGQFRSILGGNTTVSIQTYLRIAAIASLIIAGIVLQAFKKGSKILFGLSEIAIAFTTNYAIVTKLNFESLPPKIPPADMIAIVLFTFVLAKGVGTTIEGIEAKRKKDAVGTQP
jgi:hypothetical protein